MRHLALLSLLSLSAVAHADALPRFEDFPVAEGSHAHLIGPNLKSPQAHKYRTRLREAMKDVPDFAGHFTVAEWGCGSGCGAWAFVNRLTGAVWFPPFYVSVPAACSEKVGNCLQSIEYRADSELFIVTGALNEKGGGRYYYRWHNGKLTLLQAREPWAPEPGTFEGI